jgi:hypothetical protein
MPTSLPLQQEESPSSERIVCPCRKLTYGKLLGMFATAPQASFGQLKELYSFSDRCTSCEIDIRDLLLEYQAGRLIPQTGKVPLNLRLRQTLKTWRKKWAQYRNRRNSRRRTGLFVVRDQEKESKVALANVAFPEDVSNRNGGSLRYSAVLYRSDGTKLAAADGQLKNGASHLYSLPELFPQATLPEVFHGSIFIDFLAIRELGSLRPYCLLTTRQSNEKLGAWHYHDKYRTDSPPGYYHVSHVFLAGAKCWIAASNPLDKPVKSAVFLKCFGETKKAEIEIAPFGSLWAPIEELFGLQETREDGSSLFWIQERLPLMLWFSWQQKNSNVWIVQHH